MSRSYFVSILTNRSGTLCVGMTNDLARRVEEHRQSLTLGFTSRYAVDRLVHYEGFDRPWDGIASKKQIKNWRREKKLALIERSDPQWRDLVGELSDTEEPRLDASAPPEEA